MEPDLAKMDALRELSESNVVRCPDLTVAEKMISLIEEAKQKGDTVGGQIFCFAKGYLRD